MTRHLLPQLYNRPLPSPLNALTWASWPVRSGERRDDGNDASPRQKGVSRRVAGTLEEDDSPAKVFATDGIVASDDVKKALLFLRQCFTHALTKFLVMTSFR